MKNTASAGPKRGSSRVTGEGCLDLQKWAEREMVARVRQALHDDALAMHNAEQLAAGFQNEKSFIRAFKDWTGMSPGDWRARR